MKAAKVLRSSLSGAGLLALAAFTTSSRPREPVPPRVQVVRLVMDGTTPKFHPAVVTIHPGDRVRFVVAGGAPHNVSFDPAGLPAGMRTVLAAAMPNPMQPLASPLLLNDGDSYTISFAGIKPGRYEYFCMPHQAMGMRGSIVVAR